jgi:hypothetical protein
MKKTIRNGWQIQVIESTSKRRINKINKGLIKTKCQRFATGNISPVFMNINKFNSVLYL